VSTAAALGVDCNDGDSARFRIVATRADADSDSFCVGASTQACVGVNVDAGRRAASSCAAVEDCNDANPGLFQLIAARFDDDNDGWCQGVSTQVCSGAALAAPYRTTVSCLGEDCNNFNRFATASCTLTDAYVTSSNTQTCPQGRTEFNVTPVSSCPRGFSVSINVRAQRLSGGGSCQAVNATRLAQTCNFLEGSVCRVVANCEANLVE
jgi:hypothetical protein